MSEFTRLFRGWRLINRRRDAANETDGAPTNLRPGEMVYGETENALYFGLSDGTVANFTGSGSGGNGATGATGPTGEAGPAGEAGATGPTGPAPEVTAGPTSDTVYVGGVLVQAAVGPTGPTGIGLVIVPTPNQNELSVTDSLGGATTVYALSGQTGATGPVGDYGATGATGPAGSYDQSLNMSDNVSFNQVIFTGSGGDTILAFDSFTSNVFSLNSNGLSINGVGAYIQFPDGTQQFTAAKFKGEWAASASYALDDYVAYAGAIYRNVNSNANPQPDTDTNYWVSVVSGGGGGLSAGSENGAVPRWDGSMSVWSTSTNSLAVLYSDGTGAVKAEYTNAGNYELNVTLSGAGTAVLPTGIRFPDNTIQTTAASGSMPDNSMSYPHIVWDSMTSSWVAGNVLPSGTSDGYVLTWDSTMNQWQAEAPPSGTLPNASGQNQIILSNNMNQWEAATPPFIFDPYGSQGWAGSPSDGSILTYSTASNRWEAGTGGGSYDQSLNTNDNVTFNQLYFMGPGFDTVLSHDSLVSNYFNLNSSGLTLPASGTGITFPDGTTQTTAASGGGSGPYTTDATYTNSILPSDTGGMNSVLGYAATVAGGVGNSAHTNSFVGGGTSNSASNGESVVVGGNANTAAGYGSAIVGGSSNSAGGSGSFVGGGTSNSAIATYSAVLAGQEGKAVHYGAVAHAAGKFSSLGDAQTISAVLRCSAYSTGATTLSFTLNGIDRLLIPSSTVWAFSIRASAVDYSGGTAGGWHIRGVVKNNDVNTAAIVGTPVYESWTEGALVDASVGITVDQNNGAPLLDIYASYPPGGGEYRWVAAVEITQTSYGTP